MHKLIYLLSTLAIILVVSTSGTNKVTKKAGVTGVSSGCSCHTGSKTGSISVSGIPANVIAGQSYTFDITYNSGISTTKVWGIDLAASVGTLSTNGNTAVKMMGSEIVHNNPTSVPGTSYTYTQLKWTAPATAGNLTLSYAMLAGDGNTKKSNDYQCIGSTTAVITVATPVVFSSFNTYWNGGKQVSIQFSTTSETNLNYFEIERSIQTETSFKSIKRINSTGNTTDVNEYQYKDNVTGASTVYYRIKSVDKDGSVQYSNVQTVVLNLEKSIIKNIYPNPSIGNQPLHINYVANKNEKVSVELYSYLGKKMNNSSFEVIKGDNLLDFKPGTFISKGLYFIIISNGEDTPSKLTISFQ